MSLFPFGRIAMYHDLDPERWPESAALHRHPILLDLLTGSEPPESLFAEEYDVDSPEIARKVPTLITEADSSQFSAIVDVMSGRNVVNQGPTRHGKESNNHQHHRVRIARGQEGSLCSREDGGARNSEEAA